jgi:hypothetical protein
MATTIQSERCAKCGMPLAYDRMVRGGAPEEAALTSPRLCSHCATAVMPEKPPAHTVGRWVLGLLISTYLRDRPVVRAAATLVQGVPFAPASLRVFAEMLHGLPRRSTVAKYDALVLYSGGKDSSYMLAELARTGLRLCAWMLNQGYQSPVAIANAETLCRKLNVPLVIDAPGKSEMDELFRIGFGIDRSKSLDLVRAVSAYGSACWPCFSTIAARATAFCAAHEIPFCFVGTQPGQNRLNIGGRPGLAGVVPRTENLVRVFVEPLRLYVEQLGSSAAALLKLQSCNTLLLPYYEFAKPPSREAQLAKLQALGWSMPKNTGACSSNCMINELGRHVMRKRFGFDMYEIIEANERRLDRPTRRTAASPGPSPPLDMAVVHAGANMLGLGPEEKQQLGLGREASADD